MFFVLSYLIFYVSYSIKYDPMIPIHVSKPTLFKQSLLNCHITSDLVPNSIVVGGYPLANGTSSAT